MRLTCAGRLLKSRKKKQPCGVLLRRTAVRVFLLSFCRGRPKAKRLKTVTPASLRPAAVASPSQGKNPTNFFVNLTARLSLIRDLPNLFRRSLKPRNSFAEYEPCRSLCGVAGLPKTSARTAVKFFLFVRDYCLPFVSESSEFFSALFLRLSSSFSSCRYLKSMVRTKKKRAPATQTMPAVMLT